MLPPSPRRPFPFGRLLAILAGLTLGAAAQEEGAPPGRMRWEPPGTLPAWERMAEQLRQRIRISAGMWPRLVRAPLAPVVHGRIEQDGYSVEKVFFASLPGHYVHGCLFRPDPPRARMPAVLCPDGHAPGGRAYEAGAEEARRRVAAGDEELEVAARYPQQAVMVQLARMGCVVFWYDLVGSGPDAENAHTGSFGDAQALLHLQSTFGLQTWNGLRALDFLLARPDVDRERVAVAGADGAGLQALLLAGIDARPVAAFAALDAAAPPERCACADAPYLWIDTDETALAALFAPKPLALAGDAHEHALKRVYGLYDCEALVTVHRAPPALGLDRSTRALLYATFARALDLGADVTLRERSFEPLGGAELQVFDRAHPRPDDAGSIDEVRAWWAAASHAELAKLLPPQAPSVTAYQAVVGAAARVLLDEGCAPQDVAVEDPRTRALAGADGAALLETAAARASGGARIPLVVLRPASFRGRAVLWVDSAGTSKLFAGEQPTDAVRALLDAGFAVAALELPDAGDAEPPFAFARPLLAERVRAIGTARAALPRLLGELLSVSIAGTESAGPWALLAQAVAGGEVQRCYADLRGFGFRKIERADDPDMLPGALRYGGLGGLAALAAPATLLLAGVDGVPEDELALLLRAQEIAGGTVETAPQPLADDAIAAWLLQ